MRLLARQARVAMLSLAVCGLVIAPGCGKDTKETPAADKPAGGDKPAEGEAKKAPEGAEKKGAEPKTAKSGDPKPAEGDTKPAGGEGKTTEAKIAEAKPKAGADVKAAPGTSPATRGLAIPEMAGLPESVIVVSGTPSLEALFGMINKLGAKVAPGQMPPDMASVALEGLKAQMGFTDVSWIKKDAPIYVVIVDPKTYGQGDVLVLPATDAKKAMDSLGDSAKKGADGHGATVEVMFTTLYIDAVGNDKIVVSKHKDIFAKVKGFIGGDLPKWTPGSPIAINIKMDNVNKLFGAEIAQGKQMLSRMYSQMEGDLGEGQKAAMEAQLDFLLGFVESSSEVTLALAEAGGDVHLSAKMVAKPGTGMAKAAAAAAQGSSTLLATVPPNAWLAFSSKMDLRGVESLKKLQLEGFRSYAELLGLSAEESKKLMAIGEKMWTASEGDSTFAIYTDGKFPFAMQSVSKVKDAASMRKEYEALFDMLFAKGWAMAVEEANKEGAKLPATIKSFSDLVKFVNDMAGPMGAKISVVHSDEGGVALDALSIEVDWDKTPLKAEEPEAYKMAKEIVGPKLEMAIAYKGDLSVGTFGPNAIDHAKKLANGTNPGGSPGLTREGEGAAMAGVADVTLALQSMKFVPDIAADAAKIDALPKDQPFTMTLKSDGKALTFDIGLPTETIMGLSRM